MNSVLVTSLEKVGSLGGTNQCRVKRVHIRECPLFLTHISSEVICVYLHKISVYLIQMNSECGHSHLIRAESMQNNSEWASSALINIRKPQLIQRIQ